MNPTRGASPRQLAMGSGLITVLRIEYAEGKQIEDITDIFENSFVNHLSVKSISTIKIIIIIIIIEGDDPS